MDDDLNVLPLSSLSLNIKALPRKSAVSSSGYFTWLCQRIVFGWIFTGMYFQDEGLSEGEQELLEMKDSMRDAQPKGVIVNKCRTLDQVLVVLLTTNIPYSSFLH